MRDGGFDRVFVGSGIAHVALDEQRGILHTWEDKLRLLSARMDDFSQECLARLSSNIDGLQDDPGEVNGGSSTATHFLVQTHRHMKNLAVFTTGLTVGRLTALGPSSILVTAGNIIALAAASPLAAAVFAAVALLSALASLPPALSAARIEPSQALVML